VASESKIIRHVYILDTSYLLELLGVPGCSNDEASGEIRKRFSQAVKNDGRFYVPFACICELGKHISEVPDGNSRRNLAKRLCGTVKSSVNDNTPWIITPAEVLESILDICKEFAEKYVLNGIDLADSSVIHEAERLRKKYSGLGYKVHIWTKAHDLKALEPDSEDDPFLG
jgi:hypothetical protein